MLRSRWILVCFAVLLAAPAGAATYTVVNTTDSDVGSLRWAIQQANGNAGPHRIVFNITGVGVHTISLLSDLPTFTQAIAIDGTTQPGYNGAPLIELDGTGSNYALTMGAHSSVKGLIVNRSQGTGISISAEFDTVSACYVGTDASGTAAAPNGSFGIYVLGNDAMIGGRIPSARNIVSGNGFIGIALNGAARDTVMGNYVGTDVTGTVAVPNADFGIETGGSTNALIDNNLASGNAQEGIYVDSATSPAPTEGCRVTRNLVGTDASGSHALPNGTEGIILLSAYTVVSGNVVSGNGDFGIYADGAFFASHHQILGNKIGVSADGTLPLGNVSGGIELDQSSNNVVGVSRGDGSGNLIAANGGPGIEIDDTTSTDITIQGNAIGTSFNGASSLGNAGPGITAVSNRVTIGGTGLAGNVIANNNGGVIVKGQRNPVQGNAIFANAPGIGIDLVPGTGVTPNDSLDLDDGANHLQNFPKILMVNLVGNQVQLVGQLSSSANTQFTIDFYSNRQCSASGYGEGESWAGQLTATTDGTGNIGFITMIPLASVVGYVYTCTATDDAGNTSEFSPCASMSEPTAVVPKPDVSYAMGASLPSPARGMASLPFSLARPSHVQIRAYDVSGRLVAKLVERDLPAGPQRAEWALHGLAAGTYFCRLDARANDGSGQHFRASRTVVVVP